MKIKTGYIVSVHTPFNWKKPLRYVSYLIRKATNFYYNHNFIFYKLYNNIFVVESDISGVVMYPLENLTDDKILKVYKLNEGVEPKRIIERIGKTKYDFRSLFFQQIVAIYLGVWIGPKESGKEYEKFTCSEFIAWILRLPEAFKYKPIDVDKYCNEHGEVVFEGTAAELKKLINEQENA